jgi:acetylornithine/N-succinyldiaminopimelate aminotransferase
MLDEVQTGMCRTGRWFAYQHTGIRPDTMSLAKALGNGVPIGACLAYGKVAELFQPGNHATTFGGNLLACRAALAVVEIMQTENVALRAATLGHRMLNALEQALTPLPWVKAVRGKGLMLGVELDRPCSELVAAALERELLINVTAQSVVRLLPPLILSDEEADKITSTVIDLVTDFGAQQ